MAKEKKQKCPEGTPDWMLTFGDLNSLLLTFFVLLVSMAHFDVVEIQLILSPFQGGFGILTGGNSLSPGRFSDMGSSFENLPSNDKGRGMAKAYKEAVSAFQTEIKSRKVVVSVTERGIIVSLSADAYFRPGSAELDIDQARTVLEKLASLLTKTDFKDKNIRIEGHTDNTGTDPNGPWPTNWKLSSARSLSVLDYLIDFGAEPSNFSVVGYGEYQPIFPNDTEEHRSKNRRVDVVILRSK